jgi:nucleoside-diphosphate-sugar epimerase
VTTILITGGNGFVGRHLVAALLARGDRVRVLALPAEDASWLERRGVEVHRGDIRDAGSLAEPALGADAVLHLAAMMDVWRPLREYRAVNVTGTENVARAALAAGVRRFVHMSSSSVYGMGHGRPVDETFPLAPFRDPYPVTKAEGDLAVQRLMRTEGLPAVIIRPDQIFGPGDQLHFGAMADRLRAGRGILVGTGDNFMPFVYVDDVVRGLLLGLDHDAAPGHAYNITNDQPLTQRQMLTAIAEETGVDPPARRVPYLALYAAGYLAERLASLAPSALPGGRPPVTRLGVAFFATDNRYAIGRARSELGYRPVVSLRDGVALTAAWYRRRAEARVEAHEEAREQAPAAEEAAI